MLSLHDIQHVPMRPGGRSSGFWVNVALPFVKHSGGMCEKQDSIAWGILRTLCCPWVTLNMDNAAWPPAMSLASDAFRENQVLLFDYELVFGGGSGT